MIYLYQKQGKRGNKEQRKKLKIFKEKYLTRYKEHDIIST